MQTKIVRVICSAVPLAVSMFVGLPCFGGADESLLLEKLRTQSLQEIVAQLQSGGVPPPLFTSRLRLEPTANQTFPFFVDLLKKERTRATIAHFAQDAYANDLADFYRRFDQFDSYMSVILCDVAKRMLLEWAQGKLLANPDAKTLDRVEEVLARTTLTPSRIKIFFGAEAKPEWLTPAELNGHDLNEMSQRVWESHGYHQVADGYRGTLQVLTAYSFSTKAFTDRLIDEYRPVDLAFRALTTESIRVVHLGGTVEFLRRGGVVDKVDLADIRYFNSIMPPASCSQYGFAPLAIRAFRPSHLTVFLGQSLGKSFVPSTVPTNINFRTPWMQGILD